MMTYEEKAKAYYGLCREVIDYVWSCAEKGVRPLKHDAAVFTSRLERTRHERVLR